MTTKHLSPNKRITFGVLAVVGALLGYFVFYRVLVNMDQKVEDQELEVLAQQNAFIDIIRLEKALENNAEERDKLTSYFVTGETVVDFLNIIEAYATYVGVDFDIDNVTADQNKLKVSTTGSGETNAVHDLLQLIEYSPFNLTIERYDVTASTKPQESNNQQSDNQDQEDLDNKELAQPDYWTFELDITINSYQALPVN